MGLTQEHDAVEVRAATKRRLEALRDRAEKASTSKGKRPAKKGRRPSKRSKPSSASQRDPALVSSIPRAQEESQRETIGGVLPLSTILADNRERTPSRPKSRLFAKEGKRHPQYGLCHSEGDHFARRRRSDGGSSAGKRLYYRAIYWYAGAEVEWWLNQCRELNEDAACLREEIERCRAFESEAVRLREEQTKAVESQAQKDEEIARLKAELDVSKEKAQTVVQNFKNLDECRQMICDHGSRLYVNG
ncbi:hypothetical protein O6P43_008033 [Quillaja saponaria]|uniref:Uncharacterized protein n=1 Tax=Quillaja saponaria TaxID=32244 RepID=A0AAD7PWB6_QUISA|nr:hypothetical protein O6P43_008033 [Quillaja saponaria]